MKFSRKQRLSTKADFGFVFSQPLSSCDTYFRVLGRENGGDSSRLGMAVSRKNCRKSVGRNRLKRLIRESFRENYARLQNGIDYVVLPTAAATTICNETLAVSLDKHWQKVQRRTFCSANTNNRKNLNG